MKKRIFTLLLAALMIAAIPTAAFAKAAEASPRGPVRKCPYCAEGILETRFASEVAVATVTPKALVVCSCGEGRYNCWRTVNRYERTYQIICNRCGYVDGTTYEYVTRAVWQHFGCKGSGCGH